MTFERACEFCYNNFKTEYGVGIGWIEDFDDFWVFHKHSDKVEYGVLPIIVYKDSRYPEPLTFELSLELDDKMKDGLEIEVPIKYQK